MRQIQTKGGLKHTLGHQAVQVLVVGALETKVSAADVVDGLIVDHEGAVGVLEGGVGSKDRVVGLNDRGGGLGRGVDNELQLALLAVVDRQAFHQQSAEARTSTTTERVKDQETLETSTAVGDTSDLVQNCVDELLAHGVVTSCIVVGGILLSGDHLLGMEEIAVGTSADLIDNIGLKINVDGTGDVFALAYGVEDILDTGAYHVDTRLGFKTTYPSPKRKC